MPAISRVGCAKNRRRECRHDVTRVIRPKQRDIDTGLAFRGDRVPQMVKLLGRGDDIQGSGQAELEIAAQLLRERLHQAQIGCRQGVDGASCPTEACIEEPAPVLPPFRPDAPEQTPRCSTRRTRSPASASRQAIDAPVTPAPTTMMSGDRRRTGDHDLPSRETVETRPYIAWRLDQFVAPSFRVRDILDTRCIRHRLLRPATADRRCEPSRSTSRPAFV